YVHRARAEAAGADSVVVNHALLLADAEIGGGLLPGFDHLVIDEAHHLEEAATRGLRQEVDGPGLQALIDRLGSERQPGLLSELRRQPHLGASDDAFVEAAPLAQTASERVHELFGLAVGWVASRLSDAERGEDSLRITQPVREAGGWERLRAAGENATTALAGLDVRLLPVSDRPRNRRGAHPSLAVRFPASGARVPAHRPARAGQPGLRHRRRGDCRGAGAQSRRPHPCPLHLASTAS